MGRTTKLALTIASPEHGEACLVCAKIDWLGERLRRFHRHISKAEKALKAQWWASGITLIGEYKACQRDVDKWTKASPRIVQELRRRQEKLKTLQDQWKKRKGKVQEWLKQYDKPIQPVADKTTRLNERAHLYEALISKSYKNLDRLTTDLREYENSVRREIAKYVEKNFPWPIHLAWERKLNKVVAGWHDSHPICAWCGLRFGGFHVGKEKHLASGESICQFCMDEDHNRNHNKSQQSQHHNKSQHNNYNIRHGFPCCDMVL